ncbi:MAG: uroporphyrinogen decarboxylase family protein [Christensenellales bacterium]|jgi:MtaA/CmuA family methyltransferase
MTPKERLYARLDGSAVDKIPNLNIMMALAARMAGVNYARYVQDYKVLVEGNLICAEKFGLDAVSVVSDPMREASAYGAQIEFPDNGVPFSRTPLIRSPGDAAKLINFDPLDSPRTLDRVRGVEALYKRTAGKYPVIGWVEGVLAALADLRGVSELMVDLADEEDYLEETMEFILAGQCRFAKVQVEAGADIIGVGNAVASLVGPAIYDKFAVQYDRRLVEYIKSLGAKVKLHICGNSTALLPKIRDLVKPDIMDIDWMVDFEKAVKLFSGTRTVINGNMDPVSVMLRGDADTVHEAVLHCIKASQSNTCIAAGCEIPVDTPEDNLLTMNRLLYI